MNHENPIGQFLTCMAEMPKNSKGFKGTIKAMERQAEKTLFLESVLKDYIEEEFLVEKYEARKTDYLEYAVFCRFTGSSDVHVFNIFIKDETEDRIVLVWYLTKNIYFCGFKLTYAENNSKYSRWYCAFRLEVFSQSV